MSEPPVRHSVTGPLRAASDAVRRDGVHEIGDDSPTSPGVETTVVGGEWRPLPAPKVWAPRPERVELVLSDRRVAMHRLEDDAHPGWWQVAEPLSLPAGSDYAFSLDRGEPLPDPRSPWQPAGVHGLSRTVDHAAFRWSDGGWNAPALERGVFYELHIGTFTPGGTFESAIERLDDLAALGVTHVELMPVAEFPGERGWGYDGVDLFAPHHAYGGPDGLKRLVDGLHARGLAAVLDVVYNHLGPDGDYLPRFGPYQTDRYRVIWGETLNFDGPGSDEVREFVVDNALAWLRDYHFDGLRLDAVHAIFDHSAVHILEQLAERVDGLAADLGRRVVLIAESDLNDPRFVRPREAGGYGLDAQWNDDFHHALHTTLTGERHGYYADFAGLPHLARAIEGGWVYTGQPSPARGRRHGRPPSGVAATRLLGYLQNHDQVGNRALGERSSQLLPPDALEVAAALVLAGPFVPLLFQGEEWGASTPFLYFADHPDPGLAEAVRSGRHEEFAAFGWPEDQFADPGAAETFERSKLDWSERGVEPHARLLAWHRALIEARAALPSLADGDYPLVRFDEAEGWIAVERGDAVLACNLGPAIRSIRVDASRPGGLSVRLASKPGVRLAGEDLVLPPMTAALLVNTRPEGD